MNTTIWKGTGVELFWRVVDIKEKEINPIGQLRCTTACGTFPPFVKFRFAAPGAIRTPAPLGL
jgi:hypothetical protein